MVVAVWGWLIDRQLGPNAEAPIFRARSTVMEVSYRLLADGVVLVHLAFLVFVAVGGLLAWRWPAVVWAHLPAVVWSLLSISIGLDCPLTPLEKHLRRLAGEHSYPGGFIDHYVEGVIYPQRFTPALRAVIAVAVILGYAGLVRRIREKDGRRPVYSGASRAG